MAGTSASTNSQVLRIDRRLEIHFDCHSAQDVETSQAKVTAVATGHSQVLWSAVHIAVLGVPMEHPRSYAIFASSAASCKLTCIKPN